MINLNYCSVLFQIGVLTIVRECYDQFKQAKKKKKLYLLDYPKEGIKEDFAEGVMSAFFTQDNYALSPLKAEIIVNQLKSYDFTKLRETLEALYADIPFPWLNNKYTRK